MAEGPATDPYCGCEQGCSHDLGDGVLLRELLGGDGPLAPGHWLVPLAARSGLSPAPRAGTRAL